METAGAEKQEKIAVEMSRVYPSSMRYVKLLNLTRGTILAERAAVAETPTARRRGLLGTASLGDGEGMVIYPCRQVHTVGMKYPIDVVFVDGNWVVRRVVHGLKPWRLSPLALSARAALELPAGTAGCTGTLRGDLLQASPVGGGDAAGESG
jgi:uncharacterized membrane protein (UPF0127 family)